MSCVNNIFLIVPLFRYNFLISKIKISDTCRESIICVHGYTVYYKNGTTESGMLNSRRIAYKYYFNLSKEDQKHVYKFIGVKYKRN